MFRQQVYRAWVALLPGFSWVSWSSFAIRLLETVGYCFFFGLVFVPAYDFFLVRVWKEAP